PRDGKLEPAIKGDANQAEQRGLEEGEVAEIGGHPLRDERQQLTQAQNFRRGQQRVPTVRRTATRRDGGESKQRPSRGERKTVLALDAPNRFQPDWSNQHQPENEAAVQIGPQ